ncbi:hypothetical protein LZ31DRAFT_628353 [Colletotrichum somersetense]|nr:hypothetical protein LZ31DRAFT_628353 [Colletotrichum somersetense]
MSKTPAEVSRTQGKALGNHGWQTASLLRPASCSRPVSVASAVKPCNAHHEQPLALPPPSEISLFRFSELSPLHGPGAAVLAHSPGVGVDPKAAGRGSRAPSELHDNLTSRPEPTPSAWSCPESVSATITMIQSDTTLTGGRNSHERLYYVAESHIVCLTHVSKQEDDGRSPDLYEQSFATCGFSSH